MQDTVGGDVEKNREIPCLEKLVTPHAQRGPVTLGGPQVQMDWSNWGDPMFRGTVHTGETPCSEGAGHTWGGSHVQRDWSPSWVGELALAKRQPKCKTLHAVFPSTHTPLKIGVNMSVNQCDWAPFT
ncbi:unnamed protein product [Boreogadus saida]